MIGKRSTFSRRRCLLSNRLLLSAARQQRISDDTQSMKKVSVDNFRKDPYFARVEKAVQSLLAQGPVVAPVEVFIKMGMLRQQDVESWRRLKIPYLEKAIQGSLPKISRILRILRFYAHDLNLRPSHTAYCSWGKRQRRPLQFTKTGEANIEKVWSMHLLAPGLKKKARQPSSSNLEKEVRGTHLLSSD